jgi:hypothetical protein
LVDPKTTVLRSQDRQRPLDAHKGHHRYLASIELIDAARVSRAGLFRL